MTALHYAADRGYNEIIEFLLQSGANVNAVDSSGQTALMYAVTCENEVRLFRITNIGVFLMRSIEQIVDSFIHCSLSDKLMITFPSKRLSAFFCCSSAVLSWEACSLV